MIFNRIDAYQEQPRHPLDFEDCAPRHGEPFISDRQQPTLIDAHDTCRYGAPTPKSHGLVTSLAHLQLNKGKHGEPDDVSSSTMMISTTGNLPDLETCSGIRG